MLDTTSSHQLAATRTFGARRRHTRLRRRRVVVVQSSQRAVRLLACSVPHVEVELPYRFRDKAAPMVALCCWLHCPVISVSTMLDLPTALSPSRTTFTRFSMLRARCVCGREAERHRSECDRQRSLQSGCLSACLPALPPPPTILCAARWRPPSAPTNQLTLIGPASPTAGRGAPGPMRSRPSRGYPCVPCQAPHSSPCGEGGQPSHE